MSTRGAGAQVLQRGGAGRSSSPKEARGSLSATRRARAVAGHIRDGRHVPASRPREDTSGYRRPVILRVLAAALVAALLAAGCSGGDGGGAGGEGGGAGGGR